MKVISKPSIDEAIDVIFSHNERLKIWKPDAKDKNCSILEWEGMAHELPKMYADKTNWRIIGIVAESVYDSDAINIKIG